MTIHPTVSCRSWRAADCSQNNRVPVDRYVTPIYVDLGQGPQNAPLVSLAQQVATRIGQKIQCNRGRKT